ncbi:ABC transporter ATP-binding protein [Methanorbis rubei]|uniref:Molybdate/tungstate import ATP-binding protein WtpC n=1 Tax=Methanorbis rubei TaxID=3028300 RepID=A0AAE4SBN9_9EURY|nr:Vitamin B12 import ATP-binding protein BtuD [Methanocorpusculaceae archaeon Cs1]
MSEAKPAVELTNISRIYGEKYALNDVSFSVQKGEIVAVIGPSGAGKSTLMRICDMLEEPSSGDLTLFQISVEKKTKKSLRERVGILFQKTVLFDRSVSDNVALGLQYRGYKREEIQRLTTECLKKLGMETYADRNARTLSGGEGQRIAFARVLLTGPELLLLDEPTANLDPLATRMIEEMIRTENAEHNTTIILNTHDQNQGMRLANRIIVLMDGKIMQMGTPDEVFYHPAAEEVAAFVGFQNLISGTVTKIQNGVAEMTTAAGVFLVQADDVHVGDAGTLALRGEEILVHNADTPREKNAENRVCGAILSSQKIGPVMELVVDCNIPITVVVPARHRFAELFVPGTPVCLSWLTAAAHLIPKTE